MVTIERYKRIENGYGGSSLEWHEIYSGALNGAIDMMTGDEIKEADAIGIVASHIFVSFKMIDVLPGDRITYKGHTFRVKYVDNPMFMDRQLEIYLQLGDGETE